MSAQERNIIYLKYLTDKSKRLSFGNCKITKQSKQGFLQTQTGERVVK